MDIVKINSEGEITETRTYDNKFPPLHNLTSCLMEVTGQCGALLDEERRKKMADKYIRISGHHGMFEHNNAVYCVKLN